VKRRKRKSEVVIHEGPAAFGEATRPGICPLCGERDGTVRVRNFVAVPEGEVPNPRPDVWICEPCLERWKSGAFSPWRPSA